jgi:hypothetical protein
MGLEDMVSGPRIRILCPADFPLPPQVTRPTLITIFGEIG